MLARLSRGNRSWLKNSSPENLVCSTRSGQVLFGPLELLILQGTPFCNLDCDYCYLPERDNRSHMSVETAVAAVQFVLSAGLVDKEFTVVWHAGEPLVLGVDYYESCIEAIDTVLPPNVSVTHSIQTNGVLIDEQWCDFFERHGISLGLSIDGPAHLHDVHRRTRNGKGTHVRVHAAGEMLRARGIDFHVIAVVTPETLKHPKEFIEYFDGLTQSLCLNVEEIECDNAASEILATDRSVDYAGFLYQLHCARVELASRLSIREIDGPITSILQYRKTSEKSSAFNQENTPFRILNVNVEGDFSTFSPELLGSRHPDYGDFFIGNVHTSSFESCTASPAFRSQWSAIREGVDNCAKSCDYFDFCMGGSPSNKLAELHKLDATETAFCRLQKKTCTDVGLRILEDISGNRLRQAALNDK